jgi:hypothetical protein
MRSIIRQILMFHGEDDMAATSDLAVFTLRKRLTKFKGQSTLTFKSRFSTMILPCRQIDDEAQDRDPDTTIETSLFALTTRAITRRGLGYPKPFINLDEVVPTLSFETSSR